MEGIFKRFMQKISPLCSDENGNNYFYTVFRLVVATMFFMHGAQKIFGLFGGVNGVGGSVPFVGLFWFAGLIEIAVGTLIFAGLFTRLAAMVAIVEMISAYFIVHLAKGAVPLLNGGELAIMYLVAFLVILRYGAGKLSLEKAWWKSELF